MILPDNRIFGYSLTDAGGVNETKNRITGTYDSAQKSISFQEQAVLRSKVDTGKSRLCYINAMVHIKPSRFGEMLTGKFTSVNGLDKLICGKGEVTLYNVQGIKDIRTAIFHTEADAPDQIIDAKKTSDNAVIKIFGPVPKALMISESNIKISLFDNGILDGDRVSVLMNGKFVIKNYTLDTTQKVWQLKLPDSESNTISIIALNEGSSPPNTAMMILESEVERYVVELQAKVGEVRTLYLRKRKLRE